MKGMTTRNYSCSEKPQEKWPSEISTTNNYDVMGHVNRIQSVLKCETENLILLKLKEVRK
jgi:hypothetical protein